MTPKELAEKLNGCEYRDELDRVTEQAAKMNGLVVIFGASDDLMELRGAINDECPCYEGGDVFLDAKGLLPSFEHLREDGDKDGLRDYFQRETGARKVEAEWDSDGYSWTYKTDIPHATFDVMEDGDRYCRGIVFSLADAAAS